MNVTMNIECSPEEARRFMGLPDMSSVHEVYLEKMRSMMDQGITSDGVESMMRNWGPMGDASMAFWRQMFDQIGRAAKG